jgi:hydrogenase nickel incorporation protein HypA/HybF
MPRETDMHELSVTQSILEIALRHADSAGAARITDLYLVIGQLSSIVDDSVQFYWDHLSQDTLAEGSRLHFRRIPTELLCRTCGHCYTPARDEFACPACGGMDVKVVAGDEFYLESIEVEQEQ